MKKYFLKSMGCKSNQLEGGLIEENLAKNGFVRADSIENANLYILNSCTVTQKSDNEAFTLLRHAKKINPSVVTVLTGCLAQVEKENLLMNDFIDYVFGNDDKFSMANFIESGISFKVEDIMLQKEFNRILLNNTGKTRANLKVQDGCNNRCSYCIIPFARGQNRSADLDFILEQIEIYHQAGFKEVVLTGIHIGQWGLDFKNQTPPQRFIDLLMAIEEKSNIARFRLGSLNPFEIDERMLDYLKTSSKFCPHFHLSLQSMCDKTLKAMNRHYSVERSFELISQIKERFPLSFIGADIIAGFPGETDDDFETSANNLSLAHLSQIHTFPYSVRKNTVAEKMDGHLPVSVKNERARLIKAISAQKYNNFLQRNLNSLQEIIVEVRPDKKTALPKGVTRNYLTVLVENAVDFGSIRNTIQNVQITCVDGQILSKIL